MRTKAFALALLLTASAQSSYAQVIIGGGGTGSSGYSVAGPGSSTDGDIALFSGTTGKVIQDPGYGPTMTIAGSSVNLGGSITASSILDSIGSTRGTVLYRGASGWSVLAPGTSGNFLKTLGAGADPAWAAAPGGGTVTQINAGNGISTGGSSITTTGTISLTNTLNAQTSTSYATQSTDAGKIVTLSNASPIAVSLVQANTANFTSGFGTTYANIGAGAVTVTAATSVFGNNKTTLGLVTGQVADIGSDSTNYPFTSVSLPVMAQDTLLGNPNSSDYPIAMAIPSCANDGAHALVYASHALACASISSGSGTVNSGTAGNGAYYATSTTAVSDGGSSVVSFGGINVTSSTTTGLTNGMYLSSTNTVQLRAGSSNKIQLSSSGTLFAGAVQASTSGGPQIQDAAASSTVPTFLPNKAATTTGWGAQASGNVSGIIAGVEKIRLTAEGVQYKQATAPVPTGTGTPSIATGSTDEAGEVTAGASATSVIITFNLSHTNAPFCVVQSQTQLAAFSYTLSNTAITITQTATSGNKIDYRCSFP